MTNLFSDDKKREFFVWVNPQDWGVRHNLGVIGSFVSIENNKDKRMFILNPESRERFISPFESGVLKAYRAEYNLENYRSTSYANYPSRLEAMYLLENAEKAYCYAEANAEHVKGRILKRGVTKGTYKYSAHDSDWINFLRMDHAIDDQTLAHVAKCYWKNIPTTSQNLLSVGQPFQCRSCEEVLFMGRLDFPDRTLDRNDV